MAVNTGSLSEKLLSWFKLPFSAKARFVFVLGLGHLTLMAGFGLWLWSDIAGFGNSSDCTALLNFVLFGRNISAINRFLRRTSLGVYWITVVPVINEYVIGYLSILLICIPMVAIVGLCIVPWVALLLVVYACSRFTRGTTGDIKVKDVLRLGFVLR